MCPTSCVPHLCLRGAEIDKTGSRLAEGRWTGPLVRDRFGIIHCNWLWIMIIFMINLSLIKLKFVLLIIWPYCLTWTLILFIMRQSSEAVCTVSSQQEGFGLCLACPGTVPVWVFSVNVWLFYISSGSIRLQSAGRSFFLLSQIISCFSAGMFAFYRTLFPFWSQNLVDCQILFFSVSILTPSISLSLFIPVTLYKLIPSQCWISES